MHGGFELHPQGALTKQGHVLKGLCVATLTTLHVSPPLHWGKVVRQRTGAPELHQ